MNILLEFWKTQTKCHEVVYINVNAICKVLFGVYIQVILYWFCSHILVYWKYICQIYKCEFNIHFIYTGFLYMQLLYLDTWVVYIVQLGLSTYLVIMYAFFTVLSTYLVIFYAFWTRNWNKIILFYLSPLTALEEKKNTFLLSGMLQYFW